MTTGPQDSRFPDYRLDLTDKLYKADAEFIAHAPDDEDYLLAALDEARAEVELLGSALAKAIRDHCGCLGGMQWP